MAILRCPKCGKTINESSRFCEHCGNEIDKPVVDTYWSGQQEGLSIFLKCAGVLLLWLFIGQFVTMIFTTANHWIVILIATLLTAGIVFILKGI